MPREIKRCPKCGKLDEFENGVCANCGFKDRGTAKVAENSKPNYDVFRNESNSQNNSSGSSVDVKSDLPAEPDTWMYVLSFFYPVIQWILMGAYVSRGKSEYAWRLWRKTAIWQIIFAIVATIVIIAIASGM